MRRPHYRSLQSPILRWSLGLGLLVGLLCLLSFLASQVFSVVGPFVVVASLIGVVFMLASRESDQ